jgi:hypothetical protein
VLASDLFLAFGLNAKQMAREGILELMADENDEKILPLEALKCS